MSLLKSGSDPSQTKITSYFDVIEKLTKLVDDNYEKLGFWKNAETNFCPLLKQLLANAQKNASRLPRQRRHGQVLKKFSTALFTYSGPLEYEFLQKKNCQKRCLH